MKMFRRKDEGFTLVELMVVILIIGILVAIAIPVFNAARATADRRSCHANQRTIDGAIQTWVADETGRARTGVTLVEDLVPEFIAVEPFCPGEVVAAGADPTPYVITAGEVDDCPFGPTGNLHGRFQ